MWGEYFFRGSAGFGTPADAVKADEPINRTVRLFWFSGLVAAGCAGVVGRCRPANIGQLRPDHFARDHEFDAAVLLPACRGIVRGHGRRFAESLRRQDIAALDPCVSRYSRTESARCSDSRWLYASLPTLSVWPSTSIIKPGMREYDAATRASFSRATGRSVYLPYRTARRTC